MRVSKLEKGARALVASLTGIAKSLVTDEYYEKFGFIVVHAYNGRQKVGSTSVDIYSLECEDKLEEAKRTLLAKINELIRKDS